MLYNARDIANMSVNDIWLLPDGKMSIQFEDGVLETNARSTIFSWYCMVFHRQYPETPLLMENHLGNKRISGNTHLDLLGKGYFKTLDTYFRKGIPIDLEYMQELVFKTTNAIYNDFTYRLESYITSISILSFIEIVENEKVKKANENVLPNQASIDKTYKIIKDEILNEENFIGNPISEAAKSGVVSMGQVLQCVGPRGYLTDIDSNIFRNPILQGYVHGIRTLHDSMIESRSASKAQFFAKDPVADSEYFNRKMQLQTSVVRNIHMGDCGSKVTMPFRVRSTDLDSLVGKFYVDETNTLKVVGDNQRELIGKNILLRTPLGCEHHDRNGVCLVCMGEIGYSIPSQTILGHVSATVLCEIISQSVLSVKHLDGSSSVDEFKLGAYEKEYINIGADPNTIKFNNEHEGKKVLLIVSAEESQYLPDINKVKDVRKLNINRVSSLREVEIVIEDDEGEVDIAVVPVSMGNRLSSFTHEALDYIKKVSWSLTLKGDFCIDFSDWDFNKPLFEMPLKHTNMVDFMKEIEMFIKSPKKTRQNKHIKTLKDFDNPQDGLLALYTLVSSKLKINIAHLEIIVLSTLAQNPDKYDHRLPLPKWSGKAAGYEDNMALRSNSVAMAYEKQGTTLYDLRSYVIKNRSDHYLDNILMGNK